MCHTGKSLSTPHGRAEGFSSLFRTMFRSGWSETLGFVPLLMTLLYKLQGFNKVWQLIPAFKGIGKKTGTSHTSSVRNPQAAPSVLMLRTAPGSRALQEERREFPAGARLELQGSLNCSPPVTLQLLGRGSRDKSLLGCAGPRSDPALCPSHSRKTPHTRKLLWKECFPRWSCWNSCQHKDEILSIAQLMNN